MTNFSNTRRTFLKKAGGGSVAIGSLLAGCAGGGDGGDDGGGDGGGGGGNGDGGATSSQSLTGVTVGYPPWANYIALKHIEDNNILSDHLAEAGYEITELTVTWEELTLFASGQVDFTTTLSDIEGAVLASERELDLTYHGIQAPNYGGWYVRAGSDVDPENTGSLEATIQKLVAEQRPVGFAGWNQGLVWPNALILNDMFDVTYGDPDTADFNMFEADYFALPSLLERGELDMVVDNAPILGMDSFVVRDDNPLTDIFWQQPAMAELGVSPEHLNLGMYATTQEFSDNHEEFVKAFMEAWLVGVEWVHNTDNWDGILSNEQNWEYLTAETEEEARVNLEFSYQMEHSENTHPLAFREIELTDERIQGTEAAIDRMVDLDLPVSENWRDYIEFKSLELDPI